MSIEKLKELHSIIKNHPYRISSDEKYLESYRNLLIDLSSEFYTEVIKTKYKDSKNMIHDFNGAIYNIHRSNYSLLSETIQYVEMCIGTIHRFIDTGIVESYWTFYSGANNFNMPICKEFIFDEIKNKYFLYLTEKEFNKSIEWLENRCKNSDLKWHYEPSLNWVKENKKHWYG
jgi:hypothetical protein